MFTGDLTRKLFNESLYMKSFVFEDVYIGMLAKKLNSTIESTFNYVYYTHLNATNATHKDFDEIDAIYIAYYIDIVILWEMIQKRYYEILFSFDFNNLFF